MTDGGFPRTDLIAATEAMALALAAGLGLGDAVNPRDDWSLDDTDMMLGATLSGDGEGIIVLAVEQAAGMRLLAEPATLHETFSNAADAIGATLRAAFSFVEVVTITDHRPAFVVEITHAGALTSMVGLTLPVGASDAPIQDFEPQSFDDFTHSIELSPLAALTVLDDVEMVVTAELGRTTMAVRDLLGLTPGMVVEIDRVAGQPIDLLVNGRRIAAGEVVVVDEEFGIRITEIAPIADRRR